MKLVLGKMGDGMSYEKAMAMPEITMEDIPPKEFCSCPKPVIKIEAGLPGQLPELSPGTYK